MATRRIISTEKTILDQDDEDIKSVQKSDTSPAVPRDVIIKLLGFTIAMIVVPIGSFFATVHTIFRGNSTFAGALAAVMANVVLISYVLVAMKEDEDEKTKPPSKEKETKKTL
jgi:hypothetical protein